MIEVNKIYNEDCIGEKGMCLIPDKSVDMILCDLPYGTTKNKWDIIIPFKPLWAEYEKIIKDNEAIVLTCSQPFTSMLLMSNKKLFRYSLVWQKTTPTGFLNANKMPLRTHEDILVFYKSLPKYNPQKTTGHVRKVNKAEQKINSVKTTDYGKYGLTTYDSVERYPTSVLTFATDKQKEALHPTQKPVALFEYLIKMYTDEDDIVVDNSIGSGTTAIVCININRKYIGFELDKKYYDIANKRIEGRQKTK